MPGEPKGIQLDPKELEHMRLLTDGLSELFTKISNVVLPKIGQKVDGCKSFTVVLPQSGKPLTIAFGAKAGDQSIVPVSPLAAVYMDPPGI